MKSTRQHILDHLENKRIASAGELSRALRTTPANIRHHLSILLEEGVIQIAGQEPTKGRGRPTQLYTLTHQARQHNLDGLSSALLAEFVDAQPIEEQAACLRRIAQRLGGNGKTSKNLTQRLYQAVRRLNELNYHARWEAHAEAPRLILSHCPFAAILSEHPELCQMDAFLLEDLLYTPVKQTARLERDARGSTFCMFIPT